MVNIRKYKPSLLDRPGVLYCGRNKNSLGLGNPFSHKANSFSHKANPKALYQLCQTESLQESLLSYALWLAQLMKDFQENPEGLEPWHTKYANRVLKLDRAIKLGQITDLVCFCTEHKDYQAGDGKLTGYKCHVQILLDLIQQSSLIQGSRPIVTCTGHKPKKLAPAPECYSSQFLKSLTKLAEKHLKKLNPYMVISGMALGWDTAVAQAAIKLNIPLIAAIPFAGQERSWTARAQERYKKLLNLTEQVVIVNDDGYSREKMMSRNHWMLDRSNLILALWNGSSQGGTAEAIAYAKSTNSKIVNVWSDWQS
jgi:uncharacterized phage-like protein YoqJ